MSQCYFRGGAKDQMFFNFTDNSIDQKLEASTTFPRTISDWNRLPTRTTDCTTIEAFQASLGALPSSH
ncbi:hypothetical protein DPMN_029545 [Dreissena polymorpha]|uniref:Uncharacterized protein n=1 Tax=Dreissena polymorpha TaxID=45954 RepID=A0A9D4LYS5_DREPO|nr:hypothetical protein DPMN_029545 [Dreissena polymorpha]